MKSKPKLYLKKEWGGKGYVVIVNVQRGRCLDHDSMVQIYFDVILVIHW